MLRRFKKLRDIKSEEELHVMGKNLDYRMKEKLKTATNNVAILAIYIIPIFLLGVGGFCLIYVIKNYVESGAIDKLLDFVKTTLNYVAVALATLFVEEKIRKK